MSPAFLPLKWIVSILLNEQLSRDPCFAMCMIHVHACVCTSHGGTPNSKTRAELIRAIASRGEGIKQNVRGLFGPQLRKGGNSEIIRGVQKRAYLILAIASQFKGTPNANSRGIDPGHCCAEGDTDKQNARN